MALVCLLVCGGVIGVVLAALGPNPSAFLREFDGTRDLGNGYELGMLHAYPSVIMQTSLGSGPQLNVPPEGLDLDRATHSVDEYAISGNWMLVSAEPWHGRRAAGSNASRYFLVDASAGTSTEYANRTELLARAKQLGIGMQGIAWRRAAPGS